MRAATKKLVDQRHAFAYMSTTLALIRTSASCYSGFFFYVIQSEILIGTLTDGSTTKIHAMKSVVTTPSCYLKLTKNLRTLSKHLNRHRNRPQRAICCDNNDLFVIRSLNLKIEFDSKVTIIYHRIG